MKSLMEPLDLLSLALALEQLDHPPPHIDEDPMGCSTMTPLSSQRANAVLERSLVGEEA